MRLYVQRVDTLNHLRPAKPKKRSPLLESTPQTPQWGRVFFRVPDHFITSIISLRHLLTKQLLQRPWGRSPPTRDRSTERERGGQYSYPTMWSRRIINARRKRAVCFSTALFNNVWWHRCYFPRLSMSSPFYWPLVVSQPNSPLFQVSLTLNRQ